MEIILKPYQVVNLIEGKVVEIGVKLENETIPIKLSMDNHETSSLEEVLEILEMDTKIIKLNG